MTRLDLYHKGDSEAFYSVEKWTFSDKFMGEQYISFTAMSPIPIEWAVGDYCVFRGNTFTLNYVPSVTQSARSGSVADAYTYENVKFDSYQEELTRGLMLDITPSNPLYKAILGTNYTGSSQFQLFCGETVYNGATYTAVCALALKMQANLDRLYSDGEGNGLWHIYVDTDTEYINPSGDRELVTHTDEKVVSFNNNTIMEALAEVHNTFDLDYCIKGREIYIGYTLGDLTSDDESEIFSFGYGKGYPTRESMNKGLYQIKRVADSNQKIVTRLRAFGSSKNMPYRYYNKKYDLSQALFPSCLQLPGTFKSIAQKQEENENRDNLYGIDPLTNLPYLRHVLGDTNDSYIDKNDDAEDCSEGIREESARWDGSNGDLPEIFPTIEEVRYKELRGANVKDQNGRTGQYSFQGYGDNERVDGLLAVGYLQSGVLIDDANTGDGIFPESGGKSGNIDKVATIEQTSLSFRPSDYGDFSYMGDYYSGGERNLFTIENVVAGEYIMAPTHANVVLFSFNMTSYAAGCSADVGFFVKVYKISRGGARTVIAAHVSNYTNINRDTAYTEIELPSIPNTTGTLMNGIVVSERSDITVTFTPVIKNVVVPSGVTGGFSLVFKVGTSRVTTTEYSPEYTWARFGNSAEISSVFHVFIKDMGFDLSACWTDDTPKMAMKSGMCVGREFEIGSDVKKVTYQGKKGYMLTLKRASDSSLNTYYPNHNDVLAAGDNFVLLGINMPDAYIEAAEIRLLKAATDFLADNCETRFTYQPYINNIYLQQNYDNMLAEGTPEKSIFWRLYSGLKFSFQGIPTSVGGAAVASITIASVTIQMGDGLTPKVEMTLNDDVQQSTLKKITTSIDRIYNGSLFASGRGGSNTNTAMLYSILQSEGEKLFLSKRKDDEASGRITFNNGVVSNNDAVFNGDTYISEYGELISNGDSVFNKNVTIDEHARLASNGEAVFGGETIITAAGVAKILSRILLGDSFDELDQELDRVGGVIRADGTAELESLLVRSLTKVTEGVFKQLTSANPSLAHRVDRDFVDGFNGHGLQIWHDTENGKGWCMTLDTLTVRQSMYVFELVIQKIRAVGGILLVSAADGKIDTVRTVYLVNSTHSGYDAYYLITFEDTNTFVQHDLMRCQRWRGGRYNGGDEDFDDESYEGGSTTTDTSATMKYYWVEVDYSQTTDNLPTIYESDYITTVVLDDKSILVRCDRFGDTMTDPDSGDSYTVDVGPEAGDECVLMGNTTDTTRQNYIMISAAEDGVPRIDVMTGADAVGDTGDLRTRIGSLDGIVDDYWVGLTQPNGYGIYSDNAWLKGTFIVRINGQDTDVGTMLSVTAGKIQSMVESVRQETLAEEGYIRNNIFSDGLAYWYYYAAGELYMVVDVYGNGSLLTDPTSLLVATGASEYARLIDEDRISGKVLEIKASLNPRGIYQKNEDFRNLPTFDIDPQTGERVPRSFMLSFYYFAEDNSTIYTGLGDGGSGAVVQNTVLATTDEKYHKLIVSYLWDGLGGMTIYGTGHFRVYGFVLTENIDSTLLDYYVTQIEQTAQRIELNAKASIQDPYTGQYADMYFSQFAVAWNGILSKVENYYNSTNTSITQTAEAITLEANRQLASGNNKYLQNAGFYGWVGWKLLHNGIEVSESQFNDDDYIHITNADGKSYIDMQSTVQSVGIKQINADFAELPIPFTHKVNGTDVTSYPVYVEFRMKAVTNTQIAITLGGKVLKNETITAGNIFERVVCKTEWDATGFFHIAILSGHAQIYGLKLDADIDGMATSRIQVSADSILAAVSSTYITDAGVTSKLSGLGITDNFANLFSTEVTAQGVAKTAEIKTYVDGEIAGIDISADQISLEGYTTINDGFSIDEEGNATMNNATIAGVLNNLIQQKTFNSDGEAWNFNPLEWGSVIEWHPHGQSDTHVLTLPCAYSPLGDGKMIVCSNTGMTMRDLRQCVGKKFTFLCAVRSNQPKITIHCGDTTSATPNGLALLRQDYIGQVELDLYYDETRQQGMAMNTPYNPVIQLTRMYEIPSISGLYYFTAECKMGMYNGQECIYWEIYKSAQRGEVAYTVSGTVRIDGQKIKGAELEFESASGNVFRTVTDRHGEYSIALFEDDYGYDISVYANSTAQSPVHTESRYVVSDYQTKDFTITT